MVVRFVNLSTGDLITVRDVNHLYMAYGNVGIWHNGQTSYFMACDYKLYDVTEV